MAARPSALIGCVMHGVMILPPRRARRTAVQACTPQAPTAAAHRCTVKQLQEDLGKLKVTMDEERTKQDEQQAEYAESLPTYIPENVPVSLADLCQQAAEQQRSETFVLNLGSRPVTTAAPAAHGPGGRFRLPCGVRGGVFQLHDGDVLSIFGTQCHDMQCSRAAASGAPPPPLAPGLLADVPRDAPRVAFFGERAAVTSVSAAECSLSVSGACTVVEDCRVTGVGDGAGLEVVEARGDPMVHRKVVLRRCEASQCRVGLLVKGVPSEVRIEDCRCDPAAPRPPPLSPSTARSLLSQLTLTPSTSPPPALPDRSRRRTGPCMVVVNSSGTVAAAQVTGGLGAGVMCRAWCRFQDCREHNVRLQKVGTRACIVELERVHALAAARSGLVVETLCSARAVDCTFSRNGHYGVQVPPPFTTALPAVRLLCAFMACGAVDSRASCRCCPRPSSEWPAAAWTRTGAARPAATACSLTDSNGRLVCAVVVAKGTLRALPVTVPQQSIDGHR